MMHAVLFASMHWTSKRLLMLLHFRTTTVLKHMKEAGIVKRKWTWRRFLVTCCVKEKTLVVTKNPQGEGGEKRRFFWLLWPYREKMQSSHSPKGGRKERRRHTHWSMQSGLGTRHNVNILGCCFHIKMPIVKLALSKLLSQCAFELRKKKSLFSPPPLKWSFTMLSVGKKEEKCHLMFFTA